MKKLMLILAVLVIAAPAMAVTLSLDNGGNTDGWVSINYDKGAGVMPRAFALEVSVDLGTIDAYADSVSDAAVEPFNVYMGNISIDNGNIVDRGSPVAPATAPDTPGQLGTASIVIEMGSLYVPGTSDPCEPATSGTLIKLHCTDCDAVMTVTSNALRGKVVLEDTTVEDKGTSGDVCAPDCAGVGAASQAEWDAVGNPQSWCAPRQCHGDATGTEDGDPKLGYFWVQEGDLGILINGWKQDGTAIGDYSPAADPTGWIAADFTRTEDGDPKLGYFRVQEGDLGILINHWKKDATAIGDDPAVPADCQ